MPKCSVPYCKSSPPPGRRMCDRHRKYHTDHYRKRRKLYCSRCGVKCDKSRCPACVEERKKECIDKKKMGVCSVDKCKRKALPGRAMCQHHTDYYREYRRGKKGFARKVCYCESTQPIANFLQNFDAIL
jgi:hypothetical protein